ncbi:hypothetical protein [Plantactinospora sp. BC1]|nr:hypothetical protein [Plantactinospora sp. BC1]
MTVSAVNRRGRPVEVRVSGTPMPNQQHGTTGAILVMEIDEPSAC